MRTCSNDYKTNIRKPGRQISCVIEVTDGLTTYELNNDNLYSVVYSSNTDILKSVMKELELVTSIEIPTSAILNAKFGVRVDKYIQTTDEEYQIDKDYYTYVNNEYILLIPGTDYEVGDSIIGTIYEFQKFEYINMGTYLVKSSEKQEETNNYKVLCYDYLLKSMVEYKTLQNGTFPMTIKQYLSNLCTDLGLTYTNELVTFGNETKILDSDIYANLGYTYRDILDEISQVAGGNIIMDHNNYVKVKYPTATGIIIDEDDLHNTNITFKNQYGPVNTIVLSRSGESDNIYYPDPLPQNPIEVKILDNQIMNGNDRDLYMPDIYSKLNGLTYYLNDFDTIGITYLESLDLYGVRIGETTYQCLMLNNQISITGGLKESIYTNEPEESVTDYTKADKTDRRINQAYIIVDKQNQTINSLTKAVNDMDGIVSEVQVIQTSYDDIIKVITTNINTNTGDVESVRTEKDYKFDKDGLSIGTNTSDFSVLINEEGTKYKVNGVTVSQFTKDNIIIKDLVLYGKQYYGIEQNISVENFTKDDAMFVSEKYTNENYEEGYGHFWNRN